MSVLLVPFDERGDVIATTIERLVAQGDQVRVVEPESRKAARWRGAGAYVAVGAIDADLVERAGQNARTVVVLGTPGRAQIEQVLEGARLAGIERVVLYHRRPQPDALAAVRASGAEYVLMRSSVGRLRRGLGPVAVASAIDAADDLAGEPRLDLDLAEAQAWKELRLEAP